MIGGPWQGKGYGKSALEKLIQHLKAMGIPLLYTSCGQGEGSPEGFYRKLGFTPTGGHYGEGDDEIELVLQLDNYTLPPKGACHEIRSNAPQQRPPLRRS